MIIKYPKISKNDLYDKIEFICNNEKVKYTEEGINALLFVSDMDIRQAINNLECIYYAKNELTELNKRNKHWEEVQRTFIAGDTLDVSLFDNQKYGNQKLTDGTKPIFSSGYIYYPILYFGSTGSDGEIYFENLDGNNAYAFNALNNLFPYNISGSTSLQYPLASNYVTYLFNAIQEGNTYGNTGSATDFPYYKAPETSRYKVDSSLGITMTISGSSQSVTMSFQVYKSGSSGETLLAESTNVFYTTASGGGGGGGGTVPMSASITFASIYPTNRITVYNSTNGNFARVPGDGITAVNLTIDVPSDGSSTNVIFYVNKTTPNAVAQDTFVGTLYVNASQEDTFSYSAGTTITNKGLAGVIQSTDTVAIEVTEG